MRRRASIAAPRRHAKRSAVPPSAVTLDAEQRQAVQAADGVVQVIAPAGSGKTAVLIERVRELLRRGVPGERILCTTFNRDARIEMQRRLGAAGLAVEARTFHSIGWWLMREEGLARRGGPRELSFNQWRRLCALVLREEGTWIDPGDARAAVGAVKLGLMETPREFRRHADDQPDGPALARIYELYERHLAEQAVHDFDDLVLLAVRALREDAELRRRWQSRFRHVLVDEYQDIEPAQELLVRILAAPQDGFYCVGDEDQTLYGWRRASVRRDPRPRPRLSGAAAVFPGPQLPLPAGGGRGLAPPGRAQPRAVPKADPRRSEPRARGGAGAHAARARRTRLAPRMRSRPRSPAAPASRSSCSPAPRTCSGLWPSRAQMLGVRITAPEAVFEPHGARGALEAYLRLCAAPRDAEPEDVALVCRAPSRGLPYGSEERVARRLRDRLTFTASLADVPADARQRFRLDDAGRILDALAAITDASRFIAYLRGPGGLDEYFTDYEQTFGDTEKIELEVLEQAQREAAGETVAEYAALFQARRDALRGIRDDAAGIELTTIHRAKGRQWPEVHVFGCEESQLPHRRALDVSQEKRTAGEGIEAERRLAYVAFTRAARSLVVHATETAPSRFLSEAGLEPTRPYDTPHKPGSRRPLTTRGSPRLPKHVGKGPVAGVLQEAHRVGLAYALRTAPRRSVALEGAAAALEHGLIGRHTASDHMTVAELLEAIEQLTASERVAALNMANLRSGSSEFVARLGSGPRKRLVRALRSLASGSR